MWSVTCCDAHFADDMLTNRIAKLLSYAHATYTAHNLARGMFIKFDYGLFVLSLIT